MDDLYIFRSPQEGKGCTHSPRSHGAAVPSDKDAPEAKAAGASWSDKDGMPTVEKNLLDQVSIKVEGIELRVDNGHVVNMGAPGEGEPKVRIRLLQDLGGARDGLCARLLLELCEGIIRALPQASVLGRDKPRRNMAHKGMGEHQLRHENAN
jgi:hypothetical protein